MLTTTTALIALGALVLAFLIGSVTDLHMGIAAIAATCIVGPLLFNDSVSKIQSGFPLGLFFTLLGVTYLFAIANNNGTVNWIVAMGLKLVAGRAELFPFVMFFISAILTGIGCATPASAAILMPIALGFNRVNNINPLPMAQAVIQGSSAGSFSPAGVYGAIIGSVVNRAPAIANIYNPLVAWGCSMIFDFGILLVVWFLYRKPGPSEAEAANADRTGIDDQGVQDNLVDEEFANQQGAVTNADDIANTTLNTERSATLFGILLMAGLVVYGALVKHPFDVGLTAICIGAVLNLSFPKSAKGIIGQIAWPTILLVGGIVTYISMLERHGVIKWSGDLILGLGDPKFAAIGILFIGALVSAFASTTGILGALIPLSIPFLSAAPGVKPALSASWLIGALAISSSVVDCSPFSTNGALAVANGAHQGDYIYKTIFKQSWILIFGAPIITWAIMVLPGWGL